MKTSNASSALVMLTGLLMSACASKPVAPPPEAAEPIGDVTIVRALVEPAEAGLLDIGLVVFDTGTPADRTEQQRLGISPKIRRAEASYLPYVLRQTLVNSGQWGAVRVLPEADSSFELLLTGTILRSDGRVLELRIDVVDSTGRRWLHKTYYDASAESDFDSESKPVSEPFQDLYNQIANDLVGQRRKLTGGELQNIADVSLLRYATSLSPDAFTDHLLGPAEALYSIKRMPSPDDPMLHRVQRIREFEYLFIDTADEQYATLYREMRPTYDLWRGYNRKLTLYQDDYMERLAERDRDGRRGSFAAMRQTYNAFKWSKIQQQELQELAKGFDNEVAPTLMEMDGRVIKLSGSLFAQYSEWRQILRSMFALESGTTVATPAAQQ